MIGVRTWPSGTSESKLLSCIAFFSKPISIQGTHYGIRLRRQYRNLQADTRVQFRRQMEEKAPSAKVEEGTKDGEQIITITLLCMCVRPVISSHANASPHYIGINIIRIGRIIDNRRVRLATTEPSFSSS